LSVGAKLGKFFACAK